MDQPVMINGGAFQSASTAPYNLAEIWPFRINGGDSEGALDLMKVRLGQSLDQFENASVKRKVSSNDLIVLDHKLARSGGSRKQRDETYYSLSLLLSKTTQTLKPTSLFTAFFLLLLSSFLAFV